MRKSFLRTSYLLLAVSISPAFAQGVSDEGAKQVANALASYLGASVLDRGLLTVKVDGNAYRVSLDLQKASGAIKAPPLTFLTTPKADGTWDVKADGNADIVLTPKTGGDAKPSQLSFKDFSLQGTFDPKLGTFSQATTKFGSFSMSADEGNTGITAEYTNLTGEMTATPANGGVNMALVQTADGLTETIKGPTGQPIAIKLGNITGNTKIEAARTKELLGLWAFVVANVTESDVTKLAPQFKDRLMASLPLWQNAIIDVVVQDIEVETPAGSVKVAEFQEKFSLSGMVPKGTFGASFKIKGVELATGMTPEWTKALIPTDFDITADISDVNLDTAARLFVNALDFTTKDPVSDEVLRAIGGLIMAGKPKITLSPSALKTESLKLSVKGNGGFSPIPGGKVTIEAEGLDETLKTLSSSGGDENAMRAVASIGIAKSLAQESGGKQVWVIEGDASGNVTINGKSLKSLTGGQ